MILDNHPDAVDAILAAQLSARDRDRLAFMVYLRVTGRLTGDDAPIPTALVRMPVALTRETFPTVKPSSLPSEEWGEPC